MKSNLRQSKSDLVERHQLVSRTAPPAFSDVFAALRWATQDLVDLSGALLARAQVAVMLPGML